MDQDNFSAELAAAGFENITTVERAAGAMDVHVHPFEARALILAGDIEISIDGQARQYRVGDIFHLQALCPHAERYGAQGVTYLVGRKQRPG